jgi:hypothetical protein
MVSRARAKNVVDDAASRTCRRPRRSRFRRSLGSAVLWFRDCGATKGSLGMTLKPTQVRTHQQHASFVRVQHTGATNSPQIQPPKPARARAGRGTPLRALSARPAHFASSSPDRRQGRRRRDKPGQHEQVAINERKRMGSGPLQDPGFGRKCHKYGGRTSPSCGHSPSHIPTPITVIPSSYGGVQIWRNDRPGGGALIPAWRGAGTGRRSPC